MYYKQIGNTYSISKSIGLKIVALIAVFLENYSVSGFFPLQPFKMRKFNTNNCESYIGAISSPESIYTKQLVKRDNAETHHTPNLKVIL